MAILLEILAGATGSKTPWVAVEDRRSAIRFALDHGRPGDVIVLAGKGHETYQEVGGVKRHLDERRRSPRGWPPITEEERFEAI